MPFTTGLPAEVVRALTIARRVEAQARGGQRPSARAATGRLMAVIAEAGGRDGPGGGADARCGELADPVGSAGWAAAGRGGGAPGAAIGAAADR